MFGQPQPEEGRESLDRTKLSAANNPPPTTRPLLAQRGHGLGLRCRHGLCHSRTKFVFLILGSILPIAAGSLMFAEPRDLGTLDRLTTVWFPKNLNELFELNL